MITSCIIQGSAAAPRDQCFGLLSAFLRIVGGGTLLDDAQVAALKACGNAEKAVVGS